LGFPFSIVIGCDWRTDRQTSDCTVASELNWELLQCSCWLNCSCWLIYIITAQPAVQSAVKELELDSSSCVDELYSWA